VELVSTGGGANKLVNYNLWCCTLPLQLFGGRCAGPQPYTLLAIGGGCPRPSSKESMRSSCPLPTSYNSTIPSFPLGVGMRATLHTSYPLSTKYTCLYRCNYSFAATSAALCLIISFTAALLLESDCCCNLLRCSLRSLHRGTLHSESLQARAWS